MEFTFFCINYIIHYYFPTTFILQLSFRDLWGLPLGQWLSKVRGGMIGPQGTVSEVWRHLGCCSSAEVRCSRDPAMHRTAHGRNSTQASSQQTQHTGQSIAQHTGQPMADTHLPQDANSAHDETCIYIFFKHLKCCLNDMQLVYL